MRIKSIDGYTARCEARGIERAASLFLLQHEALEVGDLVMIHVGNAIQKMTEEEAQTAWDLYDEILDAEAAELQESRASALPHSVADAAGREEVSGRPLAADRGEAD